MLRALLLVGSFLLIASAGYGQLTIFQDEKGQVYTTVDEYGPGSINATAYRKLTYQGSPFLTYPVWQPGTVQLDESGKELTCTLAYDLVSNVVMCRFPGDSTVRTIKPDRFTLAGDEFIRQQNKVLGVDYRIYTKTLHDGKTKLLISLSKRKDPYAHTGPVSGYSKNVTLNGVYVPQEKYYVRKGDAQPELISLTKNAVLAALYEQADKLADRLPARRLTAADVARVLPYYDSLMTADWATKLAAAASADSVQREPTGYVLNKAPLSKDAVFNQELHHRITYPDMAWTKGVYGRVYAGFDINQHGRITNVVILSPDNGGMGFTESVRSGLENILNLDPAFAGTYALPVAFTYLNRNEKTETVARAHVPVNRLPAERLNGRTLLEELIVPVVVTKPVSASREVWGYFK